MNDLKNYREKELSLYIISSVLIFLISHRFINVDANNFADTLSLFSQIFVSAILSVIAFGFIFVVECLFTSRFKERLLYLFGFFGLLNPPGYTIFSKIKENNYDKRFSHNKLMVKYPTLYENMPITKKERQDYENEKWYEIYNQVRDVSMIRSSQREWILCRDIYISTLVMLISYIIIVMLCLVEFNIYYLMFLVVMLLVTNFGANRKANRFAYNVIAYDANNPKERKEK